MKCSHALSFCTSFAVVAVAQQYADHANTAITTLQNAYNGESGLWKGAATDLWWQSGNIVEMLARFGQADGTFKQTAADIIADTYAKSPNRQGAHDWKNDYYDDMGWWALGWIAAYDLTGNQQYLKTAEDIFTDMSGGWSTSCKAGGIWWDVPKKSISSISNELFLSTAAHLANRVGDKKKDYVNWARMEWDWFWGMGIIDNDSLAHDGLDKSTCQPNGDTIFTYNQGPILSGLSELAKATSDGGFIAVSTIHSAALIVLML
jgi:predicted alpha-1,6-mannanase (GH76 family)